MYHYRVLVQVFQPLLLLQASARPPRYRPQSQSNAGCGSGRCCQFACLSSAWTSGPWARTARAVAWWACKTSLGIHCHPLWYGDVFDSVMCQQGSSRTEPEVQWQQIPRDSGWCQRRKHPRGSQRILGILWTGFDGCSGGVMLHS